LIIGRDDIYQQADICCRVRTEEDIFLDTAPCAMAFQVLRVNGYDVSSGIF